MRERTPDVQAMLSSFHFDIALFDMGEEIRRVRPMPRQRRLMTRQALRDYGAGLMRKPLTVCSANSMTRLA
jgi:hypothetical protein